MNKTYIKPETDIVVINLANTLMGEGDAAASGEGNGEGWANQVEFEEEADVESFSASQPSLWD